MQKICLQIGEKFKDGKNPRMEQVRHDALTAHASAVDRGRSGAATRWGDSSANSLANSSANSSTVAEGIATKTKDKTKEKGKPKATIQTLPTVESGDKSPRADSELTPQQLRVRQVQDIYPRVEGGHAAKWIAQWGKRFEGGFEKLLTALRQMMDDGLSTEAPDYITKCLNSALKNRGGDYRMKRGSNAHRPSSDGVTDEVRRERREHQDALELDPAAKAARKALIAEVREEDRRRENA